MIDNRGYERGKLSHSDLIHRQIAYKEIYLKNRDKYPLKFDKYVIHHKDGNKKNNDVSNLQIVTPKQHREFHTDISWEGKKKESSEADFPLIRLLIGGKATFLLIHAFYGSIIMGLISLPFYLASGFHKFAWLEPMSIFTMKLFFLRVIPILFLIIGLLFTLGWIYNKTGNFIEKSKKVFRR
jgi:hypothetical protein